MVIILFLLYSLIFFSIIKTLKNNIFSICMASLVAQLVKNPPAMQEIPVRFRVQKITGEELGYPLQYSWGYLVAQLVKNPPAMWETWIRFLDWEDPIKKERLPTPVLWPGEFHGLENPMDGGAW